MEERAVKNQLNSYLTTFIPLIIISLLIVDTSLSLGLVPRLVTRFCYNSPNPSQVNSQCVLCNYYLFDSTQIRQSPVFLGRKKRSDDLVEAMSLESDNEKSEQNVIGDNHLDDNHEASFGESGSQAVYKFNPNEHFIVAKEVEALIIDLPEVMDDAVFSV